MHYRQAIHLLGRFHPQLSLLSEGCDTPNRAMRAFVLRPNEALSLKSFGDYDYLYALNGHAKVISADGAETPLRAGEGALQRFAIPAGTDTLLVEAIDSVLIYQVDAGELDYMASLNAALELMDPKDGEAAKRLRLVGNSQAFHRLPIEAVAEAVRRLQRMPVEAGQEIVRQGDPADAFYVIEEGEAEVWELGLYDDEPRKVNALAAGEAFGEDGLVMEGSRTATVVMTKPGTLLTMSKRDFDQLIKTQMVDWVDSGTARSLLEGGYRLLDVRYEEEYEEAYIPGATLIPLPELRRRYQELDPSIAYVAYCKGGKRSAVACLLLKQRSFEAVSLAGGIMDWPHEIVDNTT
jgi:rhodanese-related sulfurtransferase